MKRRLEYLLLWALGFSAACSEDDPMVCMYGVPHLDAEMKGRVTDVAGNPIPGIEVGLVESPGAPVADPTTTDAEGRYAVSGRVFAPNPTLRFADVDGEANGGLFATREMTVELSERDRIRQGDGSWYKGVYAREDVDVRLEAEAATEEE